MNISETEKSAAAYRNAQDRKNAAWLKSIGAQIRQAANVPKKPPGNTDIVC